jgi:hypothetical protein
MLVYVLNFYSKNLNNFRIYNYALHETLRLMENSIGRLGRPNEKFEDKKGMFFLYIV